MTLLDHVIKRSGDLMEGGSSLYVPTRHSHRHCVNGHVNILLCHMVIQDYMIHGHVTLWVEVTKVILHPAMFCGHKHC